ncbi:MAG: 50S ribosome-binding GTPase [Nanoarchaeota archaeon]|nr:50S ribosome-binding GTPase [Nanoarchaeota archaeon]
MNFQDLKKIEKYTFYIDLAFNRAGKRADTLRQRKMPADVDRVRWSKGIEEGKLTTVRDIICDRLEEILKSFPSIDNLDVFYVELIKCSLDYGQLKKSLGAINWCMKKVNEFHRVFTNKVRKAKENKEMNRHRVEYYGRISSLLKQVKNDFVYLEEARRVMKDFPAIKTKMYTVCLFGFPNVGKSTILSKLTTSKPEINSYPFTTKTLNLGYLTDSYRKMQIVDTPGTLNRFEKMNVIERQAYLALKHLADLIVYVFDLTEEYSIADQMKLFIRIKTLEKPVLAYITKTDITEQEKINEFKLKYQAEAFSSIEEIRNEIINRAIKSQKINL